MSSRPLLAEPFKRPTVLSADGLGPTENLLEPKKAWLEERPGRARAAEVETAAQQQAKITRLRIERWLGAQVG